MALQNVSIDSYFKMLEDQNNQQKQLQILKIEQLKIVIALNRKYSEVRREVSLEHPIAQSDLAKLKYDDPAFIAANKIQQQRELLIAARMGQEVLDMQVMLPAELKINVDKEARHQYDLIANFIKNDAFMKQWVTNKLMTNEDVTKLQSHFFSFESWQLTSSKTKHAFLKQIFGVTDAGLTLLLQEQFTHSWYGRSLGFLSNLASAAMLAGITGIGGWDILSQFALTGALYPMVKMLAAGVALFLGVPQDNFVSRNHAKLVNQVKAVQTYSADKFAQLGQWTQAHIYLSGGGIVFFLALLGLSAPALMFMCAPHWALASLKLQSVIITPLLHAISPVVIKGLEAAYEPAKAVGTQIALLAGETLQFGLEVLAKHGLSSMAGIKTVIALSVLAPLMLAGFDVITGGKLIALTKNIFYVGIGASVLTVLLVMPYTWVVVVPVVSAVLRNLMHTTVLRYGVSIASSWAFVGVYFVRNGLTKHLERKLKTSKSPNLARLQYVLRRWAPVLDAVVHLSLLAGTTYIFSGNIISSYQKVLASLKSKK